MLTKLDHINACAQMIIQTVKSNTIMGYCRYKYKNLLMLHMYIFDYKFMKNGIIFTELCVDIFI